MNEEQVRSLVLEQIGAQWGRTNLHGVNLRECLVPPKRISVVDVTNEMDVEVWVVLQEAPGGDGYGVVYDEESGKFGLIQVATGYEPSLFGIYGDFFDAFDAM